MARKSKPDPLESLLQSFAEVPDPRVDRTRVHPLVNILTMTFFGALSGGYARALEWSLVLLTVSTGGVAVLGTRLHARVRRVGLAGALAGVAAVQAHEEVRRRRRSGRDQRGGGEQERGAERANGASASCRAERNLQGHSP